MSKSSKIYKSLTASLILLFLMSSCKGGKLPGGDARKFPDDPKLRVKKNLEEGRGFRLNDAFSGKARGGVFDFASSNELWRASLDTIDFMPLASVNYSGGIIISDWYNSENNPNESIKISIRFLTNEIRADSLIIKVFTKKCNSNFLNCKIVETTGSISRELEKKIIKTAAKYKKEKENKKNKKKE